MKKLLTSVIFGAVLIGLAFAAVASDWVQGPTLLWRYQSDPTFSAKDSTTLTSAPVTAFFGYWLSNGSTGESQYFQAGSVTFDMVKLGEQTVTVGKITVTYADLAALNGQAAQDQWNASQADQKAAKSAAAAAAATLQEVPANP